MYYMEIYLGSQIRSLATKIYENLNYNSSKDFEKIFDNKKRGLIGFVAAMGFFGLYHIFSSSLWYESLALKTYILLLGMLISFIGGEAAAGSIMVVRYVRKILIEREFDLFNTAQTDILKSLATGGLYLSFFGSIVSSVILLAFFLAPWKSDFHLISQFGVLFVVMTVILLTMIFFIPLFSIHNKIRSSKQKQLDDLTQRSGKLLVEFKKLKDQPSADRDAKRTALKGEWEEINTMRDMITPVSEWPIGVSSIHSFGVTVAIPILVYVAEKYVDVLVVTTH